VINNKKASEITFSFLSYDESDQVEPKRFSSMVLEIFVSNAEVRSNGA
jgi:hypothetical protein